MPIFGHSMGGHGALVCELKNQGKFQYVSAVSTISNPIKAPLAYKATELVKKYTGPALNMLVDQGKADNFYVEEQHLPVNLSAALKEGLYKNGDQLSKKSKGCDHSYYFIAKFIEECINHHAKFLFQ
ncbi:hypothetical protein DPMN_144335 [Dreissena polymorpha]|uniref:S-formylglutathione hydrolase n=1 Tax=Dreissena polymorpha TaxID=45954 RepID=A0A9D4GI00_DREPO|nr:hypothetical protein DPMN_144335 [Dreissena polymorpha]